MPYKKPVVRDGAGDTTPVSTKKAACSGNSKHTTM